MKASGKLIGDAFGQALVDWEAGGSDPEIFEREDGRTDFGAGHELYVAGLAKWPPAERRAIRFARGRVLDVGCGAGRVSLHLQNRGLEVVAMDSSPLAVRTARARGVKEVWHLRLDQLGTRLRSFDTILLLGNNFGIFGNPARLRRMLAEWARRTPPHARILAESTNPYGGGAPLVDRAYYRLNRDRGRLPGQVRLRIHYQNLSTPWFNWLFVSRREMEFLLRGTGWGQTVVVGAGVGEPYVAVLEKTLLAKNRSSHTRPRTNSS